MKPSHATDRFIRLPELINKIGISRSSIYNKMNCNSKHHDSTFPLPKRLGPNTVAWLESEIEGWMQLK
ncbi:AlpA family transcriptional regulator [Formivibrio citricus]|uniref:AlpA family transcriptional regulator n=1 Tax=Formivibrio citricus TaxID=83765 RepID=UPI000B88DA1A|nr:AlpA family transcriptional regulator [Formivibrio citricus]